MMFIAFDLDESAVAGVAWLERGLGAGIATQASLKATLECARSFSRTAFRGDLSAFRVPTTA